MTQYKHVSVHEYTSGPNEGKRFLIFGKDEPTGVDLRLSTPGNEVEGIMARQERERKLVYDLPERMTKDELKDWLDEERPDAVWDALDGETAQRGSNNVDD